MPKVSPTESFLRYLALPEDESEFVELQHCAVVLISHLDRLATPYLPLSSNQKVEVTKKYNYNTCKCRQSQDLEYNYNICD